LRLNLTIRARLTLLYFTVLALSFVAFFWICDVGFRRSIETTVDAASCTNMETVERLIASTAQKGKDAIATELGDLAKLWASGALFEVADENGLWLFRSERSCTKVRSCRGLLSMRFGLTLPI
jgi:hypothetical protein